MRLHGNNEFSVFPLCLGGKCWSKDTHHQDTKTQRERGETLQLAILKIFKARNCSPESNFSKRTLPAALNLPAVNDATAFEYVVMWMLRGGQARMVGEDAQPRADSHCLEQRGVNHLDHSMFLRECADAQSQIVTFQIKHAPIAASLVELDCAAIFRERNGSGINHYFATARISMHDCGQHG